MRKYHLGEFEEIVILTIGILYKEAYGVAIKREIETRLARQVSMGAMHSSWAGPGGIFKSQPSEEKQWSIRRTREMSYGVLFLK
jgi:hypothetical protein